MEDDAVEEWRPIEGCWPYQVSNFGRVKRQHCVGRKGIFGREGFEYPEKLVVPTDAQLNLYCKGKSKWFSLAALVLNAFVGPAPEGCRLSRHLDDDRSNNHLSNLAWGTDRDNALDSVRNGTFRTFKGMKHTEESKRKIGSNNARALLGRKLSQETKLKIGLASKGKPRSEETKRKISAAQFGKTRNITEELRAKLADECSLRFKGKPRSEETKARMRIAALAREEAKRLVKGDLVDG